MIPGQDRGRQAITRAQSCEFSRSYYPSKGSASTSSCELPAVRNGSAGDLVARSGAALLLLRGGLGSTWCMSRPVAERSDFSASLFLALSTCRYLMDFWLTS